MANEMFFSLPDVMTAEQLASALQISKTGAYALLNHSDFPTLRVGGRKYENGDLLCGKLRRSVPQSVRR